MTATQLLVPPEPSLSVALTTVVAAVQESTSLRLELASERLLERAERAARRSLAWAACAACLVVVWVGVQGAFAIWLNSERGTVEAALAIASNHLLGAIIFFFIARSVPATSSVAAAASPELS